MKSKNSKAKNKNNNNNSQPHQHIGELVRRNQLKTYKATEQDRNRLTINMRALQTCFAFIIVIIVIVGI